MQNAPPYYIEATRKRYYKYLHYLQGVLNLSQKPHHMDGKIETMLHLKKITWQLKRCTIDNLVVHTLYAVKISTYIRIVV